MFGLTGIPYKAIAICVAVAATFTAGWTARGWKADSDALSGLQEQMAAVDAAARTLATASGELEIELGNIRSKERKIQNEILKILNRPVYNLVCFDTDGLRYIDDARTSTPAGEHDRAVPGATAAR